MTPEELAEGRRLVERLRSRVGVWAAVADLAQKGFVGLQESAPGHLQNAASDAREAVQLLEALLTAAEQVPVLEWLFAERMELITDSELLEALRLPSYESLRERAAQLEAALKELAPIARDHERFLSPATLTLLKEMTK